MSFEFLAAPSRSRAPITDYEARFRRTGRFSDTGSGFVFPAETLAPIGE